MECDRAGGLLSGLVDNALRPLARLRVSRHVAGCDACATKVEELRAMQAAVRTKLPYHRAPPGLAARIGASLPREEVPAFVGAGSRPWFRMPVFSLAGTGLAGALAGVALTVLLMGGQNDPTMAVIGSHIRSMQAEHLTDVLTSDQHTVKPWLSARLDVSPPVRDLKDQGFPLVGGRLDYVEGHPAAAVVYQRAKHVINLFAWASAGKPDEVFRAETRQGFNVVTWRHNGITYYAVSDVEADQLAEFARLVAQAG
jgi:anti-sigma factor RsiW